MCGIAAFSGVKGLTSDQARVATNKMKILGLFNQSRGVHGCGLYINGQIFKGIDDVTAKKNTKEFDDFISNIDFVWPELDLKSGHIMFLHTRQATAGAHVEANTHPFLIRSEDPRNNLIGVHNGTIENIWTLCNKYNVDHVGQHIHVDSKALYTLIDKVGLEILTEYKGAAALVWTKPSDPGSMYVYHGAARRDHTDKQSYEERPLWYMKAQEGIYFSSMPASLLAIRESSKQEIKFLEYNQVIKVTNGKFTTSKTIIAREDANLPPVVVRTNYATPRVGGFQDHRQREDLNIRAILEASKENDNIRTWRKDRKDKVKKDLKTPDTSLIWHETMPKKALAVREEDIVYYYRGRYYRSGGALCENLIWVKDRGVIAEELENGASAHWFFHGVAMKDQAAWEAVVQESKVPGGWAVSLDSNYAYAISRFSQYPVANMESEAIDKDDYFRFSWYFDARRINTKFTPKFSGRCYVIEDGFLVDITASNPDDKETYKLPKSDAQLLGEAELGFEEGSSCPVVGGCGQSLLPIRYTEPVSSRKTGGSHDSPFDIIFDCKDGRVEEGLDELFKTYSPIEMEAMVRFVSEKLTTQWQVKPSAQEVQAEMYNALRGGIKLGQSVRQCLGDDNLLLDSLCDILAKNREEIVTEIDSIEVMINAEAADYNTTMGYAEEFYDRHGYYPKGEPVVDAETSLSPFPDDLPFNDEPLIDGSLTPKNQKILDDLDEVFSRRLSKVARQEEEHKLASRRTDEAIGGLSELCTIADELQSMTGSDYAIDVSQVIYKGVGQMKHELAEVCEANHDPEAIRRMNTEITV